MGVKNATKPIYIHTPTQLSYSLRTYLDLSINPIINDIIVIAKINILSNSMLGIYQYLLLHCW